jgi:hypothetical protein
MQKLRMFRCLDRASVMQILQHEHECRSISYYISSGRLASMRDAGSRGPGVHAPRMEPHCVTDSNSDTMKRIPPFAMDCSKPAVPSASRLTAPPPPSAPAYGYP